MPVLAANQPLSTLLVAHCSPHGDVDGAGTVFQRCIENPFGRAGLLSNGDDVEAVRENNDEGHAFIMNSL
ncbi:MAG: hypothetical protein OEL91_05490 [Burkholderiaceae bacterium]|nr:hypothetical protein [Burkholderiaceae bacterium]